MLRARSISNKYYTESASEDILFTKIEWPLHYFAKSHEILNLPQFKAARCMFWSSTAIRQSGLIALSLQRQSENDQQILEIEGSIGRDSRPLQDVKRSAKAMRIGIPAFYAAPVTALGNPLSGRFIVAIESHLI